MDSAKEKQGGEEMDAEAMDLRAQLLAEPDKLTRPIKDIKDKYELLPHFLKMRGLVRQHIDSFNYLVNEEIKVMLSGSLHLHSKAIILSASAS